MKQSTFSVVMANSIKNLLQGYTKGIRFVAVLTMLFTMGIGQAWGATWEKATSIAVGDVVVLVYEAGKIELNGISTTSTKYGIGGNYTTTPQGLYELTVEAGSTSGTFSFKAPNNQYLYWGSGNSLATNATKNANTSWTVTFSSSNAVIKNNNDNNRQIKWNTSSPRFACYTSGQSAVQLYKKAASYTITATSNNDSYGTVSVSGTTITATPNDGYRVKSGDAGYTVTSGTAVVTNNGDDTFTVTPSSNCTITINFEAIPKYTVTLVPGSGSVTDTELEEPNAGEGVTLPTPTLDCGDWEFAGWKTTSAVATETTTKPTLIAAGAYLPTSDITLYAVYQRTETTEGGGSTTEETTNTYTFSDYTAGTQYATESHELDENVTINIQNCHLNTQLRIYSSASNNGTVISNELPGRIVSMGFNMGYKKDALLVYGSTDQTSWAQVGSISTTTTDYKDYTLDFGETNYTYFKLDVSGTNQIRIASMTITWETTTVGGNTTTTYYHSTPDCSAGDPCDALQAPNVTATATANSITLSWAAVDGATSYNIYNYTTEDLDETTSLTYTFTGLSSETEYEWGVESAKDECFKETRGTTTTQKACTDAVTISKGTETNGKFTLSTTGQQSTCDGPVTVTLSNIQPATGYQFSEITQSGVDAAKVTIDNNNKTVTYAKNTTGTSTINVTFTPAIYTITYKDQGDVAFSGTHAEGHPTTHTYNTETTLKSASKDHYNFGGWYKESNCSGTAVTTLGATEYTNDITLYAKWTAKTYTITLDANGGTFVDKRDSQTKGSATFDYIYGTYATYNDAPNLTEYYSDLKRDGYQFDKWVSAGSPWNKLFTSTGDRTIQAQWTKVDCRWIETEIEDVQPDDEVVVVITTKEGKTWALPHSGGTKTQPTVIRVTVNGNSLSGKIDNAIKWNIANDEGNLTFYPNGTTETWLYCNNENNGVRVGTTGDKIYTIDASNGYLKHTATVRYVGVYSNQDWRCYTSTSINNNIPGQTLKFYKRECLDATNYWVTWDAGEGAWEDGSSKKLESYAVDADINQPTAPSREGYRFDGWTPAPTTMPAENTTFTAKWIEVFTITWMVNGEQYGELQSVVDDSTIGTLPANPSAPFGCSEKVFMGWTEASTVNTDGTEINYITASTIPDDDKTYHAVFATAEGDGSAIYILTTNIESGKDYVIAGSDNNGDWALKNEIISGTRDQIATEQITTVEDDELGWIVSNTPSTDIVWRIDGDAISGYTFYNASTGKYLNMADSYSKSDLKLEEISSTKYTIEFLDPTYANVTITAIGFSASYKILSYYQQKFNAYNTPNDIYIYKKTGGITYSEYTTICEAIPDPVWGGAVINRNSIQVDCGSMTKLNAAEPNGPAIISFPAATNHTLTYDITVNASEGFLVSTNKTDATKYGASVTISPNKTGDNAGKITQNVYVVAVAPAMSDEDFTGTITISGKQLAENQVIDVTANVTCTQYTLTLVDRGVSTEQPTKYFAGETINEAPADPEGVCTDPIHYVFDGWAEATVAEGSTTYTKVTFPYTVTDNTKFYAVYRYVEEGSADSGDYVKLTEDLDDYSGDYLIVYEAGKVAFDGGLDELDGTENKISVTINSNTIESNATTDAAKFTIAKVDGGYSIKSASGYYIGWGGEKNGLNTNSSYTVNYLNKITDKSTICGKTGYLKFNKTSGQERFRYYQSGQETIALYRKAASYLYTTSPVCGPHLVITEGKEIYVTGGNAGGTRDLVIAQQKVSYKATRLNVGPTSQVPDVKVATNGITVGGVVTSDVKVTIDQTKEQQTDGTYTITGTITIQYQPSANNKQEDIQVQLAVDYNAEARDNFTVHARSLPAEFVIVAKSGDKWYALNGDMNNGSSANPANGQVTLDDEANPTKATYAPCNAIYTFDGLPNTGDRTYVRFQGTDGAWLWAASGTNVGIQNNVLKTTPEGSSKAYNWKLYTEDNITYRFGNANNSRQLTLSGEKFGMYASGVQDIRILPYVEKCLYNYAPSNLKVSVLKGTYVTLTWDVVAGATKYQYSTNGTTWTDAGTEPTVTINGLTGDTEYTYYIRAYHEDAGVSQECIDYAEITFTTADCDDVPTDITYSADLNSITVSWTAAAPTATIKLFMDAEGTHLAGTYPSSKSPYRISGGLNKNTTYYIQILSDGTCASPIIPVKTEDVELDIVEWKTDSIVVDINTNETVGVTLENEVSYGTGLGTEATELFFSKYYEATGNVKLVAVYNGTKNIIDLTNYTIQYGKTNWESNYITLKDFGTIKGQIQPGEEIILYSMQEKNAEDDEEIMDCVHEQYPDGAWVKVTASNNEGRGNLQFGGDKTIILCETRYDETDGEYYDYILDVIGALTVDFLPDPSATEKPSWGDKEGWVCQTGLSIADDSQIGISTNRCLLIRNNTVTSGENAVASNINDFVTLCTEWKGAQVPDNDTDNGVAASCENFAYVGTFDYSDYYTKYVPMDGGTSTFDENDRNPDGTVSIYIPDLYKRACSNIRVKLTNSDGEVLTDREYKVPIMITTTQGTDGQAFLDLQQNLATVEVDGEGNVIKTYPLSLDEVREICKTCDVVIRDNATLTKVTDGTTNDHPQVRDVMIYEGASLEVDGTNHNYTINSLSLRRKGDIVASAKVEEGGKLHLPASATAPIYLDMRVDANNWHWFTLPYNCNIADVTWVDGTPAQYNKDWFIMYYDGNSRANEQSIYENHWKVYNGTTIEAGKGYIVGIQGDITHPNHTFELRFPMATEVLTNEHVNKTVAVNAWGVNMDITPNKKGWNLVGNPYLDYYKTSENISFKGLSLIEYLEIDPVTGERLYKEGGNVPFLVTPVDGGWYEYQQELASDVEMMPFTAYFVQVGDPANENHTDGMELHAEFVSDHRGRMSLIRRAPQDVDGEQEPVIVRVEVANAKGESDKTTLIIDDRFTNEYEMNGDFFKWFGDYYRRYTKPVLYSMGADHGKRAFNALSEQLAAQPVALGMFAAQAGDYTFSLTRKRCDLSSVEEVWLYDATTATYTNLMQQDYTFTTAKTEGEGRFYLSVKMKQKTPTTVENVNGNLSLVAHQQTLVLSGLPAEAQVWVYDATGKLLHSEHTTAYQRIYPVQQAGVYFVSVKGQGDAQTLSTIVK